MKLVELPINKIIPSVFQPRETFDKGELQELADSMKEHGLINPISVKENGDGTYQIIAGERRWRAAKFAKMDKIYAIVKEITNEEQRIESLIENVHRRDLNMIEKGRGMMEIFKAHGIDMKPKEIANRLNILARKDLRGLNPQDQKIVDVSLKTNKDLDTIRQWLESISVEKEVIEDFLETPEEERVSERAMSRLSTIKEPELQKKTYAKIKKQDMGFKQASTFVTKIKKLPEVKQEIALTTDIPIEVLSEEPVEEELKLSRKDLEMKYRQKMAQKVLQTDSRVSLMDREIPTKMEKEIYVGDIECPECGEILDLIHCEPGKIHKVERKIT